MYILPAQCHRKLRLATTPYGNEKFLYTENLCAFRCAPLKICASVALDRKAQCCCILPGMAEAFTLMR
jgi:hypothetical protein